MKNMKIAILSDVHLDMNSNYVGEDLLPVFVQYLKEKEPDLILIAGDISDHVISSLTILEAIEQRLGVKTLFIPGNHDVWIKQNENSLTNYQTFANHPSSLIDTPYLLSNDYVIIGEMGWFDYTLVAPHIPFQKVKNTLTDWGDHKYTNWGCDHVTLTQRMIEKVEKQLLLHQDKKIIFATHFVPYREFLSVSNSYMDWNLYNAFMGSSKLGDLLNRHSNVEYVIFGHTHERFGTTDSHHKKIICNPLGYIGERSKQVFQQELEQSVTMIQLKNFIPS